MKNFTPPTNAKDMESYMNQLFSSMNQGEADDHLNISSANTSSKSTKPKHNVEIFETHRDVFVKIRIKDDSQLHQLKIFHTSNRLIIEGFPTTKEKQSYVLPAIVKQKGTSALYKDGVLEIQLEKAKDLQYSEINVTEL